MRVMWNGPVLVGVVVVGVQCPDLEATKRIAATRSSKASRLSHQLHE